MGDDNGSAVHRFKDAEGNEWAIKLTVGLRDRVLAEHGFDLYRMAESDSDLLVKLITDPDTQSRLLFAVCERQAKERSISRDAFKDALDAEALERGARALVDAIADFSPSRQDRQQRKRVLAVMRKATERMGQQILARLDDGTFDKAADKMLDGLLQEYDKKLKESAGSASDSLSPAPESSG